MTIFASRPNERTRTIRVGITYGPVSTYIEEDASHMRGFYDELGRLLGTIDAEDAEAKASTPG